MKLKKKVSFLLLICMLAFTGCSSPAANSSSQQSDNTVNKETDKKVIEKYNLDEITGYQGETTKDKKTKIVGMTFPYKIKDAGLEIKSVGQYSGQFIEDGSDESVKNVSSIIVSNNSKKVIQYAKISFKVNKSKTASYVITSLEPGKTALVMESSKMKYNKKDTYKFKECNKSRIDKMDLMEDTFDIERYDKEISIKNKSNKDYDTVYVYYKYKLSTGVYLGGITYRTKFENVKAGKTLKESAGHFSKKSSEILMVTAE